MEESAEETLARLVRYVESVGGRPASSPVDTALASPTKPARHEARPGADLAWLVLAASSCVLTILVFELFDRSVAMVIAAALALLAVIGLLRRIPFARSLTVGVVVAGLLVRFS